MGGAGGRWEVLGVRQVWVLVLVAGGLTSVLCVYEPCCGMRVAGVYGAQVCGWVVGDRGVRKIWASRATARVADLELQRSTANRTLHMTNPRAVATCGGWR